MKKRTFKIIMLIIPLIISNSCKKDENENCYECKQSITREKNGSMLESSNTVQVLCDKEESEIKAYEAKNNYAKTENGIKTNSKCTCALKR